MKTYILTGVIALTIGMAQTTTAEPKATSGKASPTAKVSVTEKPKPQTEGKNLPGRDCKLYEGETRQHRFPQYEIGNPNRPGCKA